MALITTPQISSDLLVTDLGDALSTLIESRSTAIGLFKTGPAAEAPKHHWLECKLSPFAVSYASATAAVASPAADGYFTFSSADKAARFNVGDVVRIKDDVALWKVKSVSGTNVTVDFLARNGGATSAATSLPTAAGTLVFVSHPIPQGSDSGPTGSVFSSQKYNCTQIFRRDYGISRTLLKTRMYGKENSLDAMSEQYSLQIVREMNEVCLNGLRVEVSDSANGMAGGLNYFATTLEVDATPSSTALALSYDLIADAASAIYAAGGEPNVVLLNQGQKRVLGRIMRSQITLPQNSTERGVSIDKLISDVSGREMRVVVDNSVPDSTVWVLDTNGLEVNPLVDSALKRITTTTPKSDGVSETILGEYTFSFKNAESRYCKIKNLKSSASALAATS